MCKLVSYGILACLVSCCAIGCTDDDSGSAWNVREQGVRDTGTGVDVRDEPSEDAAPDVPAEEEFAFEATPLATALDRMVFSAQHKELGYCVELRLVSPADWDDWDDVERPEGWAIEGLTASGSGCSPEPWPSRQGMTPIDVSGVIAIDRQDSSYDGTISVDLSLSFPENEEGVPRRVEFESGEVEFSCCR